MIVYTLSLSLSSRRLAQSSSTTSVRPSRWTSLASLSMTFMSWFLYQALLEVYHLLLCSTTRKAKRVLKATTPNISIGPGTQSLKVLASTLITSNRDLRELTPAAATIFLQLGDQEPSFSRAAKVCLRGWSLLVAAEWSEMTTITLRDHPRRWGELLQWREFQEKMTISYLLLSLKAS